MWRKYQRLTDEQLLENLQDENAFIELYNRYHRLVYYIAYEMCQNDADAQDVLQETFVCLKRYGNQIRDKKKLKAWLNQVTLSRCKDLFKKNKYHHIVNKHEQIMSEVPEKRNYMLPEKQMHFSSDQQRLYQYIQQLSETHKEVLILKYFGDYTMQEIAEMLEVSEGTVKSRLHYAKENLKALLEADRNHKQEEALTFEQLDGLIASVLFYRWKKTKCSKLHKKKISKKTIQMCSLVIASIVLAIGLFQWPNVSDKENEKKDVQSSYLNNEIEKNASKHAYYKLLDMAACKSDMESKSPEEIKEMDVLYTYLKKENNAYYHALQKMQWEKMFIEKKGK